MEIKYKYCLLNSHLGAQYSRKSHTAPKDGYSPRIKQKWLHLGAHDWQIYTNMKEIKSQRWSFLSCYYTIVLAFDFFLLFLRERRIFFTCQILSQLFPKYFSIASVLDKLTNQDPTSPSQSPPQNFQHSAKKSKFVVHANGTNCHS